MDRSNKSPPRRLFARTKEGEPTLSPWIWITSPASYFRVVFRLYADSLESKASLEELDEKFPRMAAEADDAWKCLMAALRQRGAGTLADEIEPKRGIGSFVKVCGYLMRPLLPGCNPR